MDNQILKARVAYALAHSLGRKCSLTTQSGDLYTGFLFSFNTRTIVLKEVSRHGENLPQISLPFANIVMTSIESVKPIDKFKTDKQISKGKQADRELVAWDMGESAGTTMGLGSSGNWDQFKVNEDKFGVISTYDDRYYTTELDTTGLTQEQLMQADIISKQLEKATDEPNHGNVDDEESRFSAVHGTGRYKKAKAAPAVRPIIPSYLSNWEHSVSSAKHEYTWDYMPTDRTLS